MLNFILFLTLSFFSLGFEAQTNNGTFILVRVYGKNHRCAIIESQTFEKFRSEIKLDSFKIEKFISCQILFISKVKINACNLWLKNQVFLRKTLFQSLQY